jgi:hypothetical protein
MVSHYITYYLLSIAWNAVLIRKDKKGNDILWHLKTKREKHGIPIYIMVQTRKIVE